MIIQIKPNKLKGAVNVPPSKSDAHRAIICASLANGESILSNIPFSLDIAATISSMKILGAEINPQSNNDLLVNGKNIFCNENELTLDCFESGSTLRFLIPVGMLSGKRISFVGRGRLVSRPLDQYIRMLEDKKIRYNYFDEQLPLTIFDGLKSGIYNIDGNVSSQFVTGLLLSLPMLTDKSTITINGVLESQGYVDMTLDTMKKFGVIVDNNDYNNFFIQGGQKYKPVDYKIENDYSQASFWLVAGCLGSDITCNNINLNTKQGDSKIMEILNRAGSIMRIKNNSVKAEPSQMQGFEIDVCQIPDLVPILAVLGSLSEGTTIIKNAARLRIKESDRLEAITTVLTALGADIKQESDTLVIKGQRILEGGVKVDSFNDHRIVMAAAIAATKCVNPITIDGAECVNKSYPDFWEHYKMLGGEIIE